MQGSITQQADLAQAPPEQADSPRRITRHGARAPGSGRPARSVTSATLRSENRKLLEIVRDMQHQRWLPLRRPHKD